MRDAAPSRYANSYRLGAASRITERLKEQAEANKKDAEAVSTSTGRGLVVVKGQKLKEHMSQYRSVTARRVTIDPYAYAKGQSDGDTVGLDPQLSDAPSRTLGGE